MHAAHRQYETLDIRHFSARQLRPIVEEEASVWQRRLDWDYRDSSELLLQYLDSRMLPGFVAVADGRIEGYTFCVYEAAKAVIGSLFVTATCAARTALTHRLLGNLLEVLEASPQLDRVETQLLLFNPGELTPAFPAQGLQVFPRLFLEASLERTAMPGGRTPPPPPVPFGFELTSWEPTFYQATAELIHHAYRNHIDAAVNDQYRTLDGALRFLHNIVRFPGCGVFAPAASWVLRERGSFQLAGVLLCSRVADGVDHITQLCVAPRHHRRGLGRLLLTHAMRQLAARGTRAITLTVSEANRPALALYTAAGFRTRTRFDAYVLERAATRLAPPSITPATGVVPATATPAGTSS